MDEIRLGNIYGDDKGTGFAGNVWDTDAIAPTLTTMQGGGREPHIMEINEIGTTTNKSGCEAINEIQNVVIGGMQEHQSIRTDGIVPTLTSSMGTGGGYVPMVVDLTEIKDLTEGDAKSCLRAEQSRAEQSRAEQSSIVYVRQATKDGAIACEVPSIVDLAYPTSQTRRGRVIDKGRVSPTLTTESIPNVLERWIWKVRNAVYLIRIRKLTPRECWRLMDFTDEDFDKAQAVNSNTQLYKQAGNSIVKNVLCEVFRQMIE